MGISVGLADGQTLPKTAGDFYGLINSGKTRLDVVGGVDDANYYSYNYKPQVILAGGGKGG
jgi:hypothetical protein